MNADSDGARAAARKVRRTRMRVLAEDPEAVVCVASGCPLFDEAGRSACAACTAGLGLPLGAKQEWLEARLANIAKRKSR